ncbi:hypothetical protein HNQ07_000539 [Deinococcus metalli]|uniref:Uncharacterized protein n=1 Tax=Deinococcus metalli TaxID=1141878 RepID=A0A7W8NNV4_9DEIO|nr:hypothetical protein [Deinococcus metalli]MBB5375095.1 hypothetical protein [Deinococcus metalli]GHF31594.1 hypothetical protein GCM10017781_05030 [Deinococcus metalli]
MLDRLIIDDPDVIGLLLDHQRTLTLLPFFQAPHTVADAAAHRGLKANQMAYWVSRYVQAGILESVGDAPPRRGVRSRGQLYRVTAAEFVLLPAGGYAAEEIVDRTYGPMWASLKAAIVHDTDEVSSRWAIRIWLYQGRLVTQQELPADLIGQDILVPEGNALNLWMTGRFDTATLAELRGELEDIFHRYASRIIRDRPELPRTTVHLAVARKVD